MVYYKYLSLFTKNTWDLFKQICFPDIMDYLNRLRKPVEQLQVRMQKTQFNLNEIRRITSTWVKYPLFERKDGKKDTVLCLNERGNRVAKRYAEISTASDTVHRCTPTILHLHSFELPGLITKLTWKTILRHKQIGTRKLQPFPGGEK